MSLKSWFRRDRTAAQAKELIRRAESETAAFLEPIQSLVIVVVSASWSCAEMVKSHLRPNARMTKHPELQQAYVFFEFISFFIHLMSTFAFKVKSSANQYLRLKEVVLLMTVAPQIDTFFQDRSDKPELRDKLRKALESADVAYGQTGDRSWSMLTDNVVALAGTNLSEVEKTAISDAVTAGLENALSNLNAEKFEALVKDAIFAIDRFEPDGSSMRQLLTEYEASI